MDSSDRCLVWVVGMILTALITIFITCACLHNAKYRVFAEKGYSQVIVPGSSIPVWVAPDKVRKEQ